MGLYFKTTNYSIVVNGDSVGWISPGRGLIQNDSALSYFFILCIEELSKTQRRDDIYEVKVCKGVSILTHLLFADNCFLFCMTMKAIFWKNIIDSYGKTSGQLINYQKSKIMFSSNTPPNMKQFISSLLGVIDTIGTSKYLGLPSIIGRRKKKLVSWNIDFGVASTIGLLSFYQKQVKKSF